MKTTTHLPGLPVAETHALAQSVNQLYAPATQAGNRWANLAVVVAIGVALALALLDFLTPCATEGAQCMAGLLFTARRNPWARLRTWWCTLRLRLALADVNAALAHVEADIEDLPQQRMRLRRRRNALNNRLSALTTLHLEG